MTLSTQTADFNSPSPGALPAGVLAPDRPIAQANLTFLKNWSIFWWGLSGICAVLFYAGTMDFLTSAKISLYGISIWLNGWFIAWFLPANKGRSKMSLYHDCLVIWMLSYALTNVLWEIPWVIFSPFVFENIHTIDDVVAYTDYMRESVFNMYWWVLASFGSVDLRTVNHDPTFFTLELYAFVNVLSTIYFFHLNNKRSPYRYLIPVLGCGEPIASTFIFSFTEVFSNFENMAGGVADTLLALVWTQYQYILFPMVFGILGYKLLMEDWRHCFRN
jgi:hypothetical protein